jgi:glycine/D-amino acid oxidase-like deaminating enzyme
VQSFDPIVPGVGDVGRSVAWHAARMGAKQAAVVDRRGIAEDTSSQSGGILRTHDAVPENVDLARRSFAGFTACLDDEETDCGPNVGGDLVVSDDGPRSQAIRSALAQRRAMGSARSRSTRRRRARSCRCVPPTVSSRSATSRTPPPA